MSWIVGTATDYLDLSDQVVAAASNESLDSATVAAAGTGYAVGNVLTLSGGTFSIAAQMEVTSVGGSGEVTGVRRFNDGVYTVTPGNPVSTSGGDGTGCTLTASWISNGWAVERDTTWSGSEKEVILNGSGGGSDEIYVGWRTLRNVGVPYYNWELHGFTGFDAGLAHDEQPGASPGFHDADLDANKAGCYLTLNDASMNYWLSVTPYRIRLHVRVGSAIFHAYLGYANRFATALEYPYPLLIAGNASLFSESYAQGKLTSTLTDPWRNSAAAGSTTGPMVLLDPANTWHGIANASTSASTRSQLRDRVVAPSVSPNGVSTASQDDKFVSSSAQTWHDIFPQTGLTSTPTAYIYMTDDSGGDIIPLTPSIIVFSSPAIQVMAEIDDVYWVSAFGGVQTEDRITVNGEVYRIFQNCNRTDLYAYMAVKER